MYLAEKMKQQRKTADAELGRTSIAGASAGVVTRGEVRALPVYGPGGYVWQPETGESVLVIKGGPGGCEQVVAGCASAEAPAGMLSGEVYLRAPGGASVYLKRSGEIVLTGGTIRLNGAVAVTGSLSVNGHSCNAGQTIGGASSTAVDS